MAFSLVYFSLRRQISSIAVSGSGRGIPLSERVFGRSAPWESIHRLWQKG
ncbi:MAG: hypothetical protein NC312_12465 [Bacteroides fragilis]|nr:hypothetical protein [Bacteroides fragilis]